MHYPELFCKPTVTLLVSTSICCKCQLFSAQELSMLPPEIPCSACPHFELLGAPIGRAEYCAGFIKSKRKDVFHLLSQLCNIQVAVTILRLFASFCKLAHLSQSTPTSPLSELNSTMMFFTALNCQQQLS